MTDRERGLISERTRAALAVAQTRGVKLGGYRGGPVPDASLSVEARVAKANEFAAEIAPIVYELKAGGKGLEAIASELTKRGIKTRRGGRWAAQTIKNILERLTREGSKS